MIVPQRTIRKANANDINVIFVVDHESAKTARKEFIHRALDCGNAYVVEQNGSAVALGVLEYTFFEHGFISLVYMVPGQRRKGTGEMLLRYLVSMCRNSKVFSSTNLSNFPMQALFVKVGFEASGLIHNLDPKDPEVIYYKAIA